MKAIFSALVAVLACAAASTSFAADSISSSTLDQMGFSGLSVMSDSDGLAVRGKGFRGCKSCGPRGVKSPSSKAFGNSFATIATAGCENCAPGGDAHSENGYTAEGPYSAGGENYSEAGATVTSVESVDIDGSVRSVTTTRSTTVWAGGNSSAISF